MLNIAPRAACRHPVRASHLSANRRLYLPLGALSDSFSITPPQDDRLRAAPCFYRWWDLASRLQSLVEGVKSRRAGPRIPHGNGAARGESVRAADTLRTLRGHFETLADCPAATPGVGQIHPNRRSVASAGPSPEAAHESTWVADQLIQLSSALRPAPPHTARRTPLTPSHPPRPTPWNRGQAHRLRTLVEGAESGRADPRIPHGDATRLARTHPVDGWVFRMGFGWVGQGRSHEPERRSC